MEYRLAVTHETSTVLGYRDKEIWAHLRFDLGAYKDHGPHFFHPLPSEYLHVRAVHPLDEDDGMQYRVRCRWDIGDKYKRLEVTSVKVEQVDGAWTWIIETNRP